MAGQILVPLDGSLLAEKALSCAVTLARSVAADLVLLRATWIPADLQDLLDEAAVPPQPIADQLEAEAHDYLRSRVEQLEAMGMTAQYVVEHGPPAEAILDYAAQAGAGHIVMATHGYSGLKRWTHGSVAERVLQSASVPLLLVRVAEPDLTRDWQQPMGCHRILVPLDGSRMAEQILPVVTPVAQGLGVELILFRVSIVSTAGWMAGEWYLPAQGVLDAAEEDARNYLKAVAGPLEEQGIPVTRVTSVGSVANCIVDYADAEGVDLIAMSTHGRTGLARWALGSVADRVLRAGNSPILLVRAS